MTYSFIPPKTSQTNEISAYLCQWYRKENAGWFMTMEAQDSLILCPYSFISSICGRYKIQMDPLFSYQWNPPKKKKKKKTKHWSCNMKMEFDCSNSKFATMSCSIFLLITNTIPVANLHPLDVDLLFHFAPAAFLCRHAGIVSKCKVQWTSNRRICSHNHSALHSALQMIHM